MKKTLFERAVAIANGAYDGHFTLMKFTTNWQFCFGTPTPIDHQAIAYEMSEGRTMDDAIRSAIKKAAPQIRKDLRNKRAQVKGIEGVLGELSEEKDTVPELDTSSLGTAIADAVKKYGEPPC